VQTRSSTAGKKQAEKSTKEGKTTKDKLLQKQIATAKEVEQTRELLLKMVRLLSSLCWAREKNDAYFGHFICH